jgi:hypothetical protein
MILEMLFGFISVFSLLVMGFYLSISDTKKTIKKLKKINVSDTDIINYLLDS